MSQHEPFPIAFARARRDAGDLSIEDVGLELRNVFGNDRPRGCSLSQLQKVASGAQPPTIPLMEGVAQVLGVDPLVFVEYRLAMARRSLDEHEVGLETALAQLARVEAALARLPPVDAAGPGG